MFSFCFNNSMLVKIIVILNFLLISGLFGPKWVETY